MKKDQKIFEGLPNEIGQYIFQFFTPKDLAVVARVCKLWKETSKPLQEAIAIQILSGGNVHQLDVETIEKNLDVLIRGNKVKKAYHLVQDILKTIMNGWTYSEDSEENETITKLSCEQIKKIVEEKFGLAGFVNRYIVGVLVSGGGSLDKFNLLVVLCGLQLIASEKCRSKEIEEQMELINSYFTPDEGPLFVSLTDNGVELWGNNIENIIDHVGNDIYRIGNDQFDSLNTPQEKIQFAAALAKAALIEKGYEVDKHGDESIYKIS